MGDIEMATDELRALGSRLDQLGDDLAAHDGKVDYTTDELAHRDVVGAMHEFGDNWNDNRDHLAEKLKKLGELATQTADGFEEADAELARNLLDAMAEAKEKK